VIVIRYFAAGAATAVIATLPLAALVAPVFRFPIPFGSYMSGPRAVVPAPFGAAFYGVLGGFVVQALFRSIAGVIASRSGAPDRRRAVLT
jgi:riboflavin transporter FmnP